MLIMIVILVLIVASLLIANRLYETGYKITTLTLVIPFLFACCGVYPALQHHLVDVISNNPKIEDKLYKKYSQLKSKLEYVKLDGDNDAK